jgi:hypothetical protein
VNGYAKNSPKLWRENPTFEQRVHGVFMVFSAPSLNDNAQIANLNNLQHIVLSQCEEFVVT